ncbi:MAG: response regulator [Gemmatales bacterium]|nr:response regulator [Gemmatales bacterium]MDW8386206.1 response regulator [Gemmatales bacterium]
MDTILIVDDEESVRRTFQDWLVEADLGCRILTAADAAEALSLAHTHPIDLAILDWHLGAGSHGLQLLEDLYVFNPEVVAILVTGFAHQATPLDALRMGVRDYLDKNADLNRDTFLQAVRKQLEKLRPAKRERQLRQALSAFRSEVERLLPLASAAATLQDAPPGAEALAALFQFLKQTTGATAGLLTVRSYDPNREPQEICRFFDDSGQALPLRSVSFSQSLAAAVVSLQQACMMEDLDRRANELGVLLNEVERQHRYLLAAPLAVTAELTVVLELFDKATASARGPVPFTEQDRQTVEAASRFAAHLVRQAVAERHMHHLLLDALSAAARATERLHGDLGQSGSEPGQPADPVRERLRADLEGATLKVMAPEETLRLAELISDLTARHGPAVGRFAIQLLENVDRLLRGEE